MRYPLLLAQPLSRLALSLALMGHSQADLTPTWASGDSLLHVAAASGYLFVVRSVLRFLNHPLVLRVPIHPHSLHLGLDPGSSRSGCRLMDSSFGLFAG